MGSNSSAEQGSARWAHAPEVPASPRVAVPRWFVELAAGALAVIGPFLRSVDMPDSRLGLILAVGTGTSAALCWIGRRHWLIRIALPLLAALALLPSEGRLVSLWVAANLVICDWAFRRRAPLPHLPAPDQGAQLPVAVLLGVAAWRGSSPEAVLGPAFFVATAALVTIVSSFVGHRLDHATRVLGSKAGAALASATFALLGLVLIVIPWPFQRILRVDPLEGASASGWISRSRVQTRSRSPWGHDPEGRPTPGRRLRGVAASALCIATIGLIAFGATQGMSDTHTDQAKHSFGGSGDDEIPAAFAQDHWYPEYMQDSDWLMNQRTGTWRPLHSQRVADVSTRHINVRDGVRVSWSPPACECERISVWMYGGSTTFGVGQRDHHTIASELARAAYEEGRALDVVNRGVLGNLHWMEAQRFAWDLTLESPPDLVIFYDGANEVWAAQQLRDLGRGDIPQPLDPLVEEIWRGMKEGGPPPPETPPGARLIDVEDEHLSPAELGRLATDRYGRSLKMSGDTASANGVAVRWFWQPSMFNRPPVEGEPFDPGEQAREKRTMWHVAASTVPAGVVNLSDVFAKHGRPLFNDDVHHNEEGARLVAEAILDSIRDDLDHIQRRVAEPSGS